MSGEVKDQQSDTSSSANGGSSGSTSGQTEGKTFSQTELDQIVKDRLDRERKKYADYKDLQTKAAEYEKLQAEKLTEAEKQAKRLSELEKTIADKEAAIAARDLKDKKRTALEAAGLRLPEGTTLSDLLDMMPGSNEDEIAAAVSKFQKMFPASKGLGTGTQTGGQTKPTDIDEQIAAAEKAGNWTLATALKLKKQREIFK